MSVQLQQAWQNECDGWFELGRAPEATGAYDVTRYANLTLAWWKGAPADMDNYLQVAPGGDVHPLQLLDQVEDAILASSAATNLRVSDEDLGRWREPAVARRYVYSGNTPILARELSSSSTFKSPNPQVAVRAVTSEVEHLTAIEIIHKAFQGPRALTRFFVPYGPIKVYLCYWEEQPVAAAALWPYGGVAGIYNVATLPEFRNRGIAVAVLNAICRDAAQQGFRLSTLRTVDDLIPLYEKAGFTLAGRVHNFRRAK